jgi:hypothetical protein
MEREHVLGILPAVVRSDPPLLAVALARHHAQLFDWDASGTIFIMVGPKAFRTSGAVMARP